jgi:hypothetical protein
MADCVVVCNMLTRKLSGTPGGVEVAFMRIVVEFM